MEVNSMYPPQYQAQSQLRYVSVGTRFLALLIDSIILSAVNGVLVALFHPSLGDVGLVRPGLAGLLGAIISIAYTFGMEATQGATVGKMLLGLRVVKLDGSPIGWSEAIIRNLLRIVDGLFVYLVGAILIWNSPQRQRLGDRLANTVVVRR